MLVFCHGCTSSLEPIPQEIAQYKQQFAFLNFPDRTPDMMGGQEFLAKTANMATEQREYWIRDEILRGNVPEETRHMKPVVLREAGIDHEVVVWVTVDYLAVGSDQDFVRMPMNPKTAQMIATQLDCFLPTTKLVDKIYDAAEIKLAPQPLSPGSDMIRNGYYQHHNTVINTQTSDFGVGVLASGHKKDIVITNRLLARPFRVAIYGWHTFTRVPIQPLSLVHHNGYADYSHGVRLVAKTAFVDGLPFAYEDLLRHPVYHRFLSYEGPILQPRVQMDYYLP